MKVENINKIYRILSGDPVLSKLYSKLENDSQYFIYFVIGEIFERLENNKSLKIYLPNRWKAWAEADILQKLFEDLFEFQETEYILHNFLGVETIVGTSEVSRSGEFCDYVEDPDYNALVVYKAKESSSQFLLITDPIFLS